MWLVRLALTMAVNAHADAVCTKSTTTLRSSPKDGATVSWRAAKYMPFLRLEIKNNWAKVQDLEGVVHYARAKDVTNSLRCVVVKTNLASLHKEPSGSSPAGDLRTVDRYTPFLRVNDKGDWIQVKDEAGHQAWIAKSQVWKPVVVNTISF